MLSICRARRLGVYQKRWLSNTTLISTLDRASGAFRTRVRNQCLKTWPATVCGTIRSLRAWSALCGPPNYPSGELPNPGFRVDPRQTQTVAFHPFAGATGTPYRWILFHCSPSPAAALTRLVERLIVNIAPLPRDPVVDGSLALGRIGTVVGAKNLALGCGRLRLVSSQPTSSCRQRARRARVFAVLRLPRRSLGTVGQTIVGDHSRVR